MKSLLHFLFLFYKNVYAFVCPFFFRIFVDAWQIIIGKKMIADEEGNQKAYDCHLLLLLFFGDN